MVGETRTRCGFLEALEPRTLLAGVTLLTHGWNGGLGGWLDVAADAITDRLGGKSQVPRYVLRVSPGDDGNLRVESVQHRDGTARAGDDTRTGEIIVELDYQAISTNASYSLGNIADVAVNYMLNTAVDGVKFGSLPIHSIAISRGTGLIDELSKSFARAGVWVDQETYLDTGIIPDMGDAQPVVYDNVQFVDNYWRTDNDPNNGDVDGIPVDGAYNLNAQWLQEHHEGYRLAHLSPSGYYVGTIDFDATEGGEGPIYSDWYGGDKPARDKTGFYYTRIVGGPRPLEGVWPASGGSGFRAPTPRDGPQWPNVSDVALVGGGNGVHSGSPVDIRYIYQDRDSASTLTFYFDTDRNPFNDNFARTLGSVNLAASDSIGSNRNAFPTAGVPDGSYLLAARAQDPDGHTRWSYSINAVEVSGAVPAPAPPINAHIDANHMLRIVGTGGADVISIYRSPSMSDRLIVNINGRTAKFQIGNVQSIYARGLEGNDTIAVSSRSGGISIPTRLAGDGGNDTLIAGSGQDSLYGGDGNDRLLGGAGRDRLDGGLGTDRLFGQSGKDWFAKAKTIELMDFSKGDSLLS